MEKTYESEYVVSFPMQIDGRERRVEFSPYSMGGSRYITSDKEIQQAMEKRADFGTLYTLMGQRKDEAEEKPLEAVPGISKCAEARDYLLAHGAKGLMNSKEQIKAVAKDNGIEFTEL